MGLNDILLAEGSILININLSINAVDIKIWCYCPWINLNLGGIHIDEHFVQVFQLFNALLSCLSLEVQIIDDLGSITIQKLCSKRH